MPQLAFSAIIFIHIRNTFRYILVVGHICDIFVTHGCLIYELGLMGGGGGVGWGGGGVMN